MYFLNPTTALDLARQRVEQDVIRAENRRRAREARAARRAAGPDGPPSSGRAWAPARVLRLRLGH